MQVMRIPKGNGKVRTVYAPDEEEKKLLQGMLPALVQIAQARCPPGVVHGFMPGKSPLTNALPHVGFRYTLNMDMKDFFDTVLVSHVVDLIPPELLAETMKYGAARQGLPTSPVVANIAAAAMDWDLLVQLPPDVVYTRYADDMSFSFNDSGHGPELAKLVHSLVEKHRFAINEEKTRLQCANAGRRIVTGVAVDWHNAFPTRKVRRRLRAARHQGNPGSLAGLTEWCRLKLPKAYLEEIRLKRIALDAHHATRPFVVDDVADYGKEQRGLRLE